MATIPLTQSNPELCREWHPTLNGDLTPDSVARKGVKVWWLGKCGHSWESEITLRIRGYGCPYCSGNKVLRGFNDLATRFPQLAKEWHPTLNGDMSPSKVSFGSGNKVWWLGACGHTWESSIASRMRTNCPYCSGNMVLKGFNDLESRYPELAKEWNASKNSNLKPSEITFGSSKVKVWWLGKCGHEWQAIVGNRVQGAGCSICAGKEVLAGFNDLASKYPELLEEWDYSKNTHLDPTKLISGSRKPAWWIGKCGHTWNSPIQNRSLSGAGCPKCAPGGYNSVDSGILYFIHNPKLLAFKVGITNPGSKNDRLSNFKSKGWSVIATWENSSGRLILETETKFFIWLRREMNIPQLLDKSSIGTPQGASETFSDSILTQAEVIAKIEELIKVLKGQGK